MKKLPLIFCLLFLACSEPKQMVTGNHTDFSKYQQPYHVFGIGQWKPGYVVLTLTDARNTYFIVEAEYNASLKRGDIYTP